VGMEQIDIAGRSSRIVIGKSPEFDSFLLHIAVAKVARSTTDYSIVSSTQTPYTQ